MIAGLVGTVRVMRYEQTLDYHRRQARMAINRIFESAFSNYAGSYEVTFDKANGNSITSAKRTFSAPVTNGFNSDDCINIDRRAIRGTNWLNASVAVNVKDTTINVGDTTSTSTTKVVPMDTHLVTITLKWREAGNASDDSLTLKKRLPRRIS